MRVDKTILPSIILVLFFIKPVNGGGVDKLNQVNSILYGIFNFQFEKARHLLDSEIFEKKTEQFLRIELAWWQAVGKGNDKSLHKFRDLIESQKKQDAGSSTQCLILQTYRLRYDLALNKYPAALIDYIKLKNLLKDQTPPTDSISLHGHLYSLYVSLIELVETSYNLNPFKANIDTQKKNHIQNLENHAASNNFIRSTLGKYFLFKYYCDIAEETSRAEIYKRKLHERFPNNPYFKQEPGQQGSALTKNIKSE